MARNGTVSKWGNSLGVRLPKHVAEKTGMTAGSKVTIEAGEDGVITIKPARSALRFDLQDLLSQVTSENRHPEMEWGGSVGKEQIE